MFSPASTLQQLWAHLLVEELVRCEADTFFVAPGSRSTPLVVAVARHPTAQSVLHYDERAAAFAALGYGRATGRPASLVTTSGTAVANAHPAVVEAATDGVPMLLLTADRPPEKRDTGANQTIDQVKFFGDYVRWQFDLPVPSPDVPPEMVLTTVDQAAGLACRRPPGPVHLNCMFRKPLEPAKDRHDFTEYLTELKAWREDAQPYTTRPVAEPTVPQADLSTLAERLQTKPRGLVIAGRLDSTAEARAVQHLAETLGWPLLPDATARLRLTAAACTVPYADQVLASDAFRAGTQVEAVVHVGGRAVSKRLRLFLKTTRPSPYVVARPDPRRLDPDHRVTHHLETNVATFADALAERLETPSGEKAWLHHWQAANEATARVLDDAAGDTDALSEPLVARLVSQHLPDGGALVLGSSMPVRDVNRYSAPADKGAVPVFANRGASGIDGTLATAAGIHEGFRALQEDRSREHDSERLSQRASEGDDRPVTLLLGDLALLHDLGALALLKGRSVTVVVVNNGGGGIFHFLPIAEHPDVFEPHFTAPHALSFEQAAAMFDLAYFRPSTPRDFAETYRKATESGGPALIEVHTDREENRALHEELEDRVAAAIKKAVEEEPL